MTWASDKRYGRQAGAWAGPDVDELLDGVQKARLAALRDHKWPTVTIPAWRAIADDSSHPSHRRAVEVLATFRNAGPMRQPSTPRTPRRKP